MAAQCGIDQNSRKMGELSLHSVYSDSTRGTLQGVVYRTLLTEVGAVVEP